VRRGEKAKRIHAVVFFDYGNSVGGHLLVIYCIVLERYYGAELNCHSFSSMIENGCREC